MTGSSVSNFCNSRKSSRQETVDSDQPRRNASKFSIDMSRLKSKLYKNTVKRAFNTFKNPNSLVKSADTFAQKHRGEKTWVFRQGATAIHKFLKGPAKKGVCDSLTVYWMQAKAQNISVKDDLGEQGFAVFKGLKPYTREGNLDTRKLKDIVANHGSVSSLSQLTSYFDNQLNGSGVKLTCNRELTLDFDLSVPDEDGPDVFGGEMIEEMVDKLIDMKEGSVAQIGIWSKSYKGHSLGVEVTAEGAVNFFDPNAGEFSFANKSDFLKFFRDFYEDIYVGDRDDPFNLMFKFLVFDVEDA